MLTNLYPDGTLVTKAGAGFRIAIPLGTTVTPLVVVGPNQVAGDTGGGQQFPTIAPKAALTYHAQPQAFVGPQPATGDDFALEGTSLTHEEVQAQAEPPPNAQQVSTRTFDKAVGTYHVYTDPYIAVPAGVVVLAGLGLLARALMKRRG